MKKLVITTFAFAAVILQSCSTQVYTNKNYVKKNDLTGKKVAVLPVEVTYTGRLPKGYSIDKKMWEEESESELIQNLVYSQYLYKAGTGSKKRKAVQLINIDQVNSRLREKGISTRDAWSMDPDSLGKLVGADLVLMVHLKKDRIMSETAAFGVDVAGSVIDKLLNKSGTGNTSVGTPGNTKTYTINMNATLSDVNNHQVVSKFSRQDEASWSKSPESVVRSTGKRIVKKGMVYAEM